MIPNCRKIQTADDEAIAKIIRKNLEKFHLNIPGTVYFDPELDHLSSYYNSKPENRCYFIALGEKNQVIGGIGIAEFDGLENCAELQKLYLDDSVKGRGYSKELLAIAEDWAINAGYRQLYLETHTNLSIAMKLYEKLGFTEIERPANLVHGGMDHFYIKDL